MSQPRSDSLGARFNEAIFGWGSPVAMGLVRILFSFWALANLAMIAPGFEDWFTDSGYTPHITGWMYYGDVWRVNLLATSGSTALAAAVYAGTMLAALMSLLGLWTRISTILLAIGMVTIHHRTGWILHGGDTILRQFLILIAIAPSGAAVSLDRLLAVRKGKAPALPPDVSLWPQRLMMFQVALVYFTTLWHKWGGTYWKDGTAIWYPLHLNEFDKFPLPDFMNDLWFINLATYGTVATQLSLATLAYWKPVRRYVLLAGVGMHLFIEYAMNVPLFSFLMISAYVSFYEGREIQAWWDRVKARWGKAAPAPASETNADVQHV